MRPLPKSSSTMLLSRSLMSLSGNVRSTRASPSTSPLRREVTHAAVEQHHPRDRQARRRLQVLLRLAGAANSLFTPTPAPMPSAPATGATSSHLFRIMRTLPEVAPKRGEKGRAVRPRHGPNHIPAGANGNAKLRRLLHPTEVPATGGGSGQRIAAWEGVRSDRGRRRRGLHPVPNRSCWGGSEGDR